VQKLYNSDVSAHWCFRVALNVSLLLKKKVLNVSFAKERMRNVLGYSLSISKAFLTANLILAAQA